MTTATVVAVILTALLKCVHSQGLVSIQFTDAPVLATSEKPAVFSIVTVSDILSTTWTAPDGGVIGVWTAAGPVINGDFTGRVSLTATRLQIIAAELRDAGNYSVNVAPSDSTGLNPNTRSVELKVFVAVAGVSLSVVPSVPVEGRNVTMRCTWSAGTQTSVAWGRGNVALISGDRIIISGGTLVINPSRRDDSGEYSCTVSNSVSVETARTSLTVYFGPDTPTLAKESADCVAGGDAVVGQALQITCTTESLPPAIFSWQHDGQAVSSSQSETGSLSLQISSSDQSGRYVCMAQNSITGGSSQQETEVSVVDTCLSGGAVAGIVIACFLVIVIIIVIIIVLLRQRNMDRRLQDAISLQKTSQDPVTLPPPANNRAEPMQDPPLHNLNTRQSTYHQPNIPNGHTNNLQQNGLNNSNINNAIQQNGRLSNRTPQRNGNTTTDWNTIGNGNGNGYSGHQNDSSFPNSGQQNPNIVIQTGQTQPGALQPTVHVNLNTLRRTDQQNANTQPQTVNVNLNTYPPPSSGRQEVNTFSAPQVNTLPHDNMNTLARYNQNTHQGSPIQTGYSYVNPAFQPDVTETRLPPQSSHTAQRSVGNDPHVHSDFVQARQSHPTDVIHAGHRSASRQLSTDDNLRHSDQAQTRSRTRNSAHPSDPPDSRDPVEHDARHRQRPWDTIRGTPAYPNHQANPSGTSSSSSSTGSQSSGRQLGPSQAAPSRGPGPSQAAPSRGPGPSQAAPSRGQPTQTSRPAGSASRAREPERDREARSANGRREDHSPAFMDPNAQRQRAQQAPSSSHVGRQQAQSMQRQAVSQSQNTAAQANPSQMATTTTRSAAVQMPTVPQHLAAQPQGNPQSSQHPLHVTHVSQVDRSPRTQSHTLAQSRPEQRQTAPQGTSPQAPRAGQNPSSLSQATLQHQTRNPHNPSANRNQQPQAALQGPMPQARQQPRTTQPAQPPPATQKTNDAGRRPPTPPAVLQPLQFQTMPRDRPQRQRQPQQQQARMAAVARPGAVPVIRHSVHVPPGHRPPGATQRPRWHVPTDAHRHPGDAHLHANLQRHAIAHRPPPAHMRQVHRGRPRQ
ncbi:uncharacterized protein si:dkeyp-97a10.3 [Clupea harengus]|uniref:Uncharacterized protein si:dkeyp-97a10.3 n=1 Tax=Clupea harengus TaxID=7950 RepID=A0A6P8G6N2_CLUHA|nr:uncharacterized protein si:dkeyp-97a10.3 [Clupea harengus]